MATINLMADTVITHRIFRSYAGTRLFSAYWLFDREMPPLHDNELLVAIAAGKRHALEDLYLGYYARLACFLSRCTPRDEDVEGIINDIFMAVWRNAMDFRHEWQASTWIIGIAYRTALKSLRHQTNLASEQSADDKLEQISDPTRKGEIKDWLADGLNRLPLEQRLTLGLAYDMGHSLDEIAEITNSPVEAVKARMFHAREKLRVYLPTLAGGDIAAG